MLVVSCADRDVRLSCWKRNSVFLLFLTIGHTYWESFRSFDLQSPHRTQRLTAALTRANLQCSFVESKPNAHPVIHYLMASFSCLKVQHILLFFPSVNLQLLRQVWKFSKGTFKGLKYFPLLHWDFFFLFPAKLTCRVKLLKLGQVWMSPTCHRVTGTQDHIWGWQHFNPQDPFLSATKNHSEKFQSHRATLSAANHLLRRLQTSCQVLNDTSYWQSRHAAESFTHERLLLYAAWGL